MSTLASMFVEIGGETAGLEQATQKGALLVDQFGRTLVSASAGATKLGHESERAGKSVGFFGVNADKLSSSLTRSLSVTGILSNAIRRFSSLLTGIGWGIVIGAAASLTSMLFEQARAWLGLGSSAAEAGNDLAKAAVSIEESLHAASTATLKNLQGQIGEISGLAKFLLSFSAINFEFKASPKAAQELRAELTRLHKALMAAAEADRVFEEAQRKASEEVSKGHAIVKAATSAYNSLMHQAGTYRLELVKLTEGEDAWISALAESLVKSGESVVAVNAMVAALRELNAEKAKQAAFEERIADLQAGLGNAPIESFGLVNPVSPTMGEDDPRDQQEGGAFASMTSGLQVATGALEGWRVAMDESNIGMMAHGAGVAALGSLYQGIDGALREWISGESSLGQALKKATGAVLVSIAARAAAEAIFMTAIGIAALTPWGAALYGPAMFWFKAAAMMATIAVVTGAAGAAMSRSSAAGSAGGPAGVSGPSGGGAAGEQAIVLNLTVNAGAVDQRTIDLLSNQLIDSLGRVLEDTGGRAGNLIVNTRRL